LGKGKLLTWGKKTTSESATHFNVGVDAKIHNKYSKTIDTNGGGVPARKEGGMWEDVRFSGLA